MSKVKSQPAASVHLNWELPSVGSSESIELYNEANVLNTAIDTYFCVIQFYPGGYCGMQQRNSENDKIAIYSVWDNGNKDLQVVAQGPDVTVEPFGGEGTGLKSTKPLDWQVGEKVCFRISNEFKDAHWLTSCYITFNGEEQLMATFQQTGANPVQSFTSFVEDWNRGGSATGMLEKRTCNFSGTSSTISGVTQHISGAIFTKNTSGEEQEGSSKCYAEKSSNGIVLSTGGVIPTNTPNETHVTGP